MIPTLLNLASAREITIYDDDETTVLAVAPAGTGTPARLEATYDDNLMTVQFGAVRDLPDPEPRVDLLVSLPTAVAYIASGAPARADLRVVGRPLYRDGALVGSVGVYRVLM